MDLVGVRRLGGTAAQCVWCPSCPNPNNHGASAPQRAAARDSELLAEYIDAVQQLTTIVHRGTVDPVEMRRLSEHVQVVRLVRRALHWALTRLTAGVHGHAAPTWPPRVPVCAILDAAIGCRDRPAGALRAAAVPKGVPHGAAAPCRGPPRGQGRCA